jgi:hypothetical protein
MQSNASSRLPLSPEKAVHANAQRNVRGGDETDSGSTVQRGCEAVLQKRSGAGLQARGEAGVRRGRGQDDDAKLLKSAERNVSDRDGRNSPKLTRILLDMGVLYNYLVLLVRLTAVIIFFSTKTSTRILSTFLNYFSAFGEF